MDGGGSSPAEGDRALAALLRFHGVAMNGGVLHAVEIRSAEEIQRAIEGYRYLALGDAAGVIEWVQGEAASLDLESGDDAVGRLEVEADDRYAAAIPTDATIVSSFESRLRQEPGAFSPL